MLMGAMPQRTPAVLHCALVPSTHCSCCPAATPSLPCSFAAMVKEPWWSDILLEGTELQRAMPVGDIKREASAPSTTGAKADLAPAAASAAKLPASTATRKSSSARTGTRKRKGAKQSPQVAPLHATTPPPEAKRPRRRSTKSTTSQRPSARERLVGAGHKGRPPKGQGFPWDNPAVEERMRDLNQRCNNGELTHSVRSVALSPLAWALLGRSARTCPLAGSEAGL